tara:strand:- start:144 stop:683 length:540 start_codon:yes stop_codon:yes gene_type:complete
MADTGFLTSSSNKNALNVFFSTLWNACGSGVCIWLSSGRVTIYDFSSDSLPAGAEVTGAEVLVKGSYGLSNANASLDISISINGGSSFSSTKNTGAFGSTSVGSDDTLGSSSDLWGLDWSSFSDLGDLEVKGEGDGSQNAVSDCAQIKIYYSVGDDPIQQPIRILSGKVAILGGKVEIK